MTVRTQDVTELDPIRGRLLTVISLNRSDCVCFLGLEFNKLKTAETRKKDLVPT